MDIGSGQQPELPLVQSIYSAWLYAKTRKKTESKVVTSFSKHNLHDCLDVFDFLAQKQKAGAIFRARFFSCVFHKK
ncbi:hypothetical protein [Abditibacterium utsteinense]|uniref:hypothetical protein n=1 Tax=Abditibacterium utsteinense TaxID=1960156 RepID=UPI0013007F16|nr:hypothetical protein [Abditibacterium utsteinense]